jgi:hypothetical protein
MKGRKGVYLAAAVVSVAGFLLVAGPAGASRQVHATAATNVHCGDTINTSITLNGDLDCSGYNGVALNIDSAGVTFDLGGHTITGNNSQYVVVADTGAGTGCNSGNQCDNVTVTNGSITGGLYQVDVWGNSDVVSNLTLTGAATTGVWLDYATSSTVSNNTISGAGSYDLYGEYDAGNMVAGNIFKDSGSENVYDEYGNANTFSSNISRVSGASTSENYYEYESDQNVWTGNVATSGSYGFDLDAEGDGYITVTNNAARSTQSYGFYLYDAYGSEIYAAGPFSMISGNQSNYNQGIGFYDEYGLGATYQNNTASRNGSYGFNFYEPSSVTASGNTAKYNADDGFYIEGNDAYYHFKAFTNNTSMFNAGWGFYADYGENGSGNVGGGTNSSGDCEDLAGCS